LQSFHRRCCGGITRDFIHQDEESGEWICPSSKEVLEKAGVLTVEEYIQRRRDTILPYARSTNIYGRCKNAKKLGSNLLWWEVNYYSSNDAAEVREDQAVNGFNRLHASSNYTQKMTLGPDFAPAVASQRTPFVARLKYIWKPHE
jgi:hypothetical protein